MIEFPEKYYINDHSTFETIIVDIDLCNDYTFFVMQTDVIKNLFTASLVYKGNIDYSNPFIKEFNPDLKAKEVLEKLEQVNEWVNNK